MGVAGVSYDPSDSIMQTALRTKSTIIPPVIGGSTFWLLLLLNVGIVVARRTGYYEPHLYNLELPWDLTDVTGGLMTFFVCFYNQHVFGRYNKLYNIMKRMTEVGMEIVSILRAQCPSKEDRITVARLIVANIVMFVLQLRRSPINESVLISEDYDLLQELRLLGETELKALSKHCVNLGDNAFPSYLPLQWAMEVMRSSTENPEERDDMLCGFYSRVYRLRSCQAQVVAIIHLPMPFQYFHIMNLMLVLNLVLWAYALGCQESFFAPVIYMFVQMMFQGIRELSTALSDPFGDDEVDFPTLDWCFVFYKRVYAFLTEDFVVEHLELEHTQPLVDPEIAQRRIRLYVDLEEAANPRASLVLAAAVGGASATYDYAPVAQDEEFDDPES
eukprot:TRINITY_DN46587_c0_g1_i1.p1 TRINITY_DN46587_c0_g1~~TRINITY_DN46587_c0_g1_i1.p1  ORF type:complete len:388 (+),score=73.49 TRINITY_DN46587_c0_g1_i1:224-1387(+)